MTINEIETWLANKGTTLWGIWDVADPVQRHQAAEWFARQHNELIAFTPSTWQAHGVLWGA